MTPICKPGLPESKMKDLNKIYLHPNACGPLTMRQLTDASDDDIVSACINYGYDPYKGGMTPAVFMAAARQLGVKLSSMHEPKEPMCLGEIVKMSKDATFVVGVRDHVLVVKNGKALDAGAETPMWAMVDVVMMAED